jgi:hypothetical protein
VVEKGELGQNQSRKRIGLNQVHGNLSKWIWGFYIFARTTIYDTFSVLGLTVADIPSKLGDARGRGILVGKANGTRGINRTVPGQLSYKTKGAPMEEKRKRGQRGPSAHNKEQQEASRTVPMDQIREIFEFWKTTFAKTRPVLDMKRKTRIGWAIRNYGMDGCRQAIEGCMACDFHMGKNARNTVYNDITLIFRDAQKVEYFLGKYEARNKKSAKEQWIDEEPF